MSFLKHAGLLLAGAAAGFGLSLAVAPARAQSMSGVNVDGTRLAIRATVMVDTERAVFIEDTSRTGCYLAVVREGSEVSAITQAPASACATR